jgi:hypothetical protein|tara:strand:- start:3931 stop:4155 length:225 start_codon:yes stop_codon:yes gene_type:complete
MEHKSIKFLGITIEEANEKLQGMKDKNQQELDDIEDVFFPQKVAMSRRDKLLWRSKNLMKKSIADSFIRSFTKK